MRDYYNPALFEIFDNRVEYSNEEEKIMVRNGYDNKYDNKLLQDIPGKIHTHF